MTPDEEPAPSLAELRERSRQRREKTSAVIDITGERLKALREAINKIFQERHEDSLPLQEVREYMSSLADPFSEDEMKLGFEKLADDNRIMIADNMVYLI